MHILYPSNPLRPHEPDGLYADEHAAASAMGFGISLFSHERLIDGIFQPRPALPAGVIVVYRGWMLTASQYSGLHAAIGAAGATMLTSAGSYARCHYLPGWYSDLREFTPETRFFDPSEDIAGKLSADLWTSCFLKDHVKSLSIPDGSLVLDLTRIPTLLEKMREFRGEIEGGICARRVEDFVPNSEVRFFVFRGSPFSAHGAIPEPVVAAAQRIESPFFSVDVARRRDGVLRIVELGDGQVSDRKEWTPQALVSLFTGKSEPVATANPVAAR